MHEDPRRPLYTWYERVVLVATSVLLCVLQDALFGL